jgi:hypothetical protein
MLDPPAELGQLFCDEPLPCIPHQHPRRPDLGGVAPLARAAAGFGERLVLPQPCAAGAALPVGAVEGAPGTSCVRCVSEILLERQTHGGEQPPGQPRPQAPGSRALGRRSARDRTSRRRAAETRSAPRGWRKSWTYQKGRMTRSRLRAEGYPLPDRLRIIPEEGGRTDDRRARTVNHPPGSSEWSSAPRTSPLVAVQRRKNARRRPKDRIPGD